MSHNMSHNMSHHRQSVAPRAERPVASVDTNPRRKQRTELLMPGDPRSGSARPCQLAPPPAGQVDRQVDRQEENRGLTPPARQVDRQVDRQEENRGLTPPARQVDRQEENRGLTPPARQVERQVDRQENRGLTPPARHARRRRIRNPRSALRNRKGVILLVILALLALFTLLGLTLVMATAQARLNALASARANVQALHNGSAVDEVFNQVIRGSNDPNSVLRIHSLLEDLYGTPLLLGRVSSTPGPTVVAPPNPPNMSFGQLISMQVTAIPGNNPTYNYTILASGEYCGLVITMLNGPAKGRSSRVVGHAYFAGTGITTLQVMPFGGIVPNGPNPAIGYLGDQFLINGRPFSGTGFGFDPQVVINNYTAHLLTPTASIPPTPLLTSYDSLNGPTPGPITNPLNLPVWYYALMPNPATMTLGGGMTATYTDPSGPGGANESYDVPDFQNMILALHYYDSTFGMVTPLPSLHRPDLVMYWANQTNGGTTPPPTANPNFLSRVLLRPMYTMNQATGTVQPIQMQEFIDVNGNGIYDAGEPFVSLYGGSTPTYPNVAQAIATDFTSDRSVGPNKGAFDPIQGPWWDVDNDGDNVPDSIWVDAGLEVQTAADGTKYKLLAAILCVDMDGKINLNAHGALAQLDPDRYGLINASDLTGTVKGPFAGSATGTVATGTVGARNLTIGQGVGSWEINPLYLLMRNPMVNGTPAANGTQAQVQALNDMLILWQGFQDNPSPGALPPIYYDGLLGESQRPGLLVPTNNPSSYTLSIWNHILGGPRAGVSRWYDATTFIPHDPFALARTMGVRPFLLQPTLPANNPGTFFDYLPASLSALNPSASPTAHVPTSYGSPYDFHGRGITGVDIAGHEFYAGTPALSWTLVQNDPSFANAPLNDVADNPADLDLSPNAQHDGWLDLETTPPTRVTKDQPFGPDELSHILRPLDADMLQSPSRLNHLANLSTNNMTSTYAAMTTYGGTLPPWPFQLSQRWSMTTDSRALPVPDTALLDFAATYAGQQDMMNVSIYNPSPYSQKLLPRWNGNSIVDLMRARILVENQGNPNSSYGLANSPDLALFGNVNGNPAATPPVWPLLAPELIEGLKLDINRLLGNGRDDNLNGVVDDPNESLMTGGEQLLDPTEQYNAPGALGYVVAALVDQNNDGLYPKFDSIAVVPADATNADFRARQLLARQLYVLMMLLVDDRYAQASIFNPAAMPWPRPMSQVPPSALTTQAQAAYVIAQWAINAVDFRDADSIMTPFEFDLHPFLDDDSNPANGTWDVDDVVFPASGVVFPPNPLATPADDLTAWRGLVFGCEQPELLITETVATHDRGTADTNQAAAITNPPYPAAGLDTYVNEVGKVPPDTDYDQIRRPRGTLAVELYATGASIDAPRYDTQSLTTQNLLPIAGVDLSKVYVDVLGNLSPVWRLAVVYSPLGYDKYTGAAAAQAPYALDPRVPVLPSVLASNVIHRVAYFGTGVTSLNNHVTDIPPWQTFYVDQFTVAGTPLVVPAGQYALIGASAVDPTSGYVSTFIGGRTNTADTTVGPNGKQNLYPMQLRLWGSSPFGVGTYPGTNPSAVVGLGPYIAPPGLAGNIKQVLGVPLAHNLFAAPLTAPLAQGTATGVAFTSRFSLSEPESGYPVPAGMPPSYLDDDGFYYLTGAGQPVFKYPQTPYDSLLQPVPSNPGQTKANPNIGADGTKNPVFTIPGYTTIYLQRLANPLETWDLYANPYITVDSMPVDLSAYTGEAWPPPTAGVTPYEPKYGGGVGGVAAFDNLRRGQPPTGQTLPMLDSPNLWRPLPPVGSAYLPQPALGTCGLGILGQPMPLLYSTLGYLNQEYWFTPALVQVTQPNWSSGFYTPSNLVAWPNVLAISAQTGVSAYEYLGAPLVPFPWLTWNNRPYVSQYELMLVPASGPSSLLGDLGLLGARSAQTTPPGTAGAALNQYAPSLLSSPITTLPFAQFGHFLNFYDDTAPPPTNVPGYNEISRLYRAFDYIHVPSRYAGTQEMLNPAQFVGNTAGAHPFHPPFNWLNQYREPGRVNLNTIYDPQVFQGVMDDYPGTWNATASNLWLQLIGSRRGYGGVGGAIFAPNAAMPTIFANPFRAAGTSPLVPLANMMNVDLTNPNPLLWQWRDVNSTFLRALGSAPGGNLGFDFSMFDANSFDTTNLPPYVSPSGGGVANEQVPPPTNQQFLYRYAGRNPYFEYSPQSRLGNLTTNHSNVYAIWITLGKFKVQQGPVSANGPDGYYLVPGGELGADTGSSVRPKAFYIYDRSIPMGFIRGEDLNNEKGVLYERVLQ